MNSKEHKITIIGCGLVGMVLALRLSNERLSSIIIEKNSTDSLMESKDSRTTAISQGSSRILNQLGLWKKISEKAQPIERIFVSEGMNKKGIQFESNTLNEGPLGYIVKNKYLKTILFKEILKSKNIRVYDRTEIINITNNHENVSIETKRNRFSSSLLVGADGRYSQTRYFGDLKYYFHDYKQIAYVFNITHEKSHESNALERFFPTGPMALLPVKSKNNKSSSVVWTQESSSRSRFTNKKKFSEEFNKNYNDFFGKIKTISKPIAYDLNVFSCYDYFKGRILLIGDACQAIHPIAGQGFNLGIRDANDLGNLLSSYSKLGIDISDPTLLRKYSQKRFLDKNLLFQATHHLNKLFSNRYTITKVLRDFGLRTFNKSSFLKKKSMLFAMGLIKLDF